MYVLREEYLPIFENPVNGGASGSRDCRTNVLLIIRA